MVNLELPDIEPRKGRKSRFMTRVNVRTFIALISDKKRFKKFHPFLEKINEVLKIPDSSEGTNQDLQDLSIEMKSLDPKLYKKLTDKIFDSDKKSAKHKSVKIDKKLIEILQGMYPEFEVKEDLINKALTDLIKTKNQPSTSETSARTKSYDEFKKGNKRRTR